MKNNYYRNEKFTDIYPDVQTFLTEYKTSPLYDEEMQDTNLMKLYYLLYAKYGNSTIASSDINQFKYKLYSIIYDQGPIWQKYLYIQKQLRSLSNDEILKSSEYINSHAYNPGQYMNDNGILDYINDQTKSTTYNATINAYYSYLNTLNSFTETFLDMFKSLFLTVVAPEKPGWYAMDSDIDEEIE